MKTRLRSSRWLLAAVAIGAVCFSPRASSAPNDATEFPYSIAVEVGAIEFAPGDGIVIAFLRGNRQHLEIGGRYLLEGTYTLSSEEKAKIGWSITTRGPSAPTPVGAGENAVVTRGAGTFRLIKTFLSDGWPHVSFNANQRSHGGVYFGEAGVENKRWSDFSEASVGNSILTIGRGMDSAGSASPLQPTKASVDPSNSGNVAIMEYLGNPVPPPANLDARYAPEGLVAAFTQMSRTAGWKVLKLAVDDSEFPYLVYGVVANGRDLAELKTALGAMPGYVYGGSVTGGSAQGSGYFSLNMTPSDRYPRDQMETVQRRQMIRLQMLAKKVQK